MSSWGTMHGIIDTAGSAGVCIPQQLASVPQTPAVGPLRLTSVETSSVGTMLDLQMPSQPPAASVGA